MSDQGAPQENEGVSGYVLGDYAPANFDNAEIPLEPALDITGGGGSTLVPYSQLVNNVLNRNLYEIKEKTTPPVPIPGHWKKRIREFMMNKNEDLVKYLKKPIPPNSPFGKSEHFLSKFGRQDFHPRHPSLDNLSLDVSGNSYMAKVEEEIKSIGPSSPIQIIEQVKYLYESYRNAGDEALRQENNLRMRLDTLDKTYQKIIAINQLPSNEHSDKLGQAIEVYIKKVVEDNQIEDQYKNTVESYRKFLAYRELMHIFRFADLQDKEPLCMICLEESVMFALNPCGHTFCNNCVKKQLSTCYMCRTGIKDRIRIYFG